MNTAIIPVTQSILLFLALFSAFNHSIAANAEPQLPPEMRADTAVVFMYHHFGVDKYPATNVSLTQFEAHIAFLQHQGYHIWPLADIIATLEQGRLIPERTVAITVDDAYRSVYTEAWPRLRQLQWPFTVFVSTEGIDQGLSAYMSWEQMREMRDAGVSFANHSRHHHHMTRQQADEDPAQWLLRVRSDIEFAQQRLQQELGTTARLFAYPYGEYNLRLRDLLKELGYHAFTQQSGAIALRAYTDRQLLPRFPMANHYADLEQFSTKVATLSLPVISAMPEEPTTENTQPTLTITLDIDLINQAQRRQLRCYVNGQGQTPVTWLNEKQFTVMAQQPLAKGRSRYNCTAPSQQGRRFFWYSRLWLIPGGTD
jgi:peptidoglycan/xylan/chitin deacetylase (PgdA/CDA1 family)